MAAKTATAAAHGIPSDCDAALADRAGRTLDALICGTEPVSAPRPGSVGRGVGVHGARLRPEGHARARRRAGGDPPDHRDHPRLHRQAAARLVGPGSDRNHAHPRHPGRGRHRIVESRRGAVAVGFRWRWPALSRRRLSPACRDPVSPPRSSNRTCRFPASGSPTGFTSRHTADGQFRLVSRDDTVARDQPSPCGRAPSEAFGYFQVLPGSSPITDPWLLRKRTRSQGPFLRRHYPASQVVRPCPIPARPAVLATASEARPPTETGLPRLPGPHSQRAVPITPVDRSGCIRRLLPHSTRPSPTDRRVGIHDFTFEACSGFTRVTARWVVRPPKAAFVTRLRDGQLPDRPAR